MVFSGNLSQPWAFGDTLHINLTTPFAYNPADGNLLMADENGVHLWSYVTNTWSATYPLPGGDSHPVLRNFNSNGIANISFNYGAYTDRPIVGDWNRDGVDTPGVVR